MLFIKSPLLSPPCETAGPRDTSPGIQMPPRFLSCLEPSVSLLSLVFNNLETFPLANMDYKIWGGTNRVNAQPPQRTAGCKEY